MRPRDLMLMAMMAPLLFTGPARAEDYGVFGALFKVSEPSVLNAIYGRLDEMERNGELAAMAEEMEATARARINRPRPVEGLGHTEVYNSYQVDLSITVNRDLSDHRGVVFARAGTRINPLEYSRFNRRLVFIDGDVPEQVAFAVGVAAKEPAKIILVNGAPLDLTEKHEVLFYFDQAGIISNRFELSVVPSVVSRADPYMLVEEIPVPVAKAERP